MVFLVIQALMVLVQYKIYTQFIRRLICIR